MGAGQVRVEELMAELMLAYESLQAAQHARAHTLQTESQ